MRKIAALAKPMFAYVGGALIAALTWYGWTFGYSDLPKHMGTYFWSWHFAQHASLRVWWKTSYYTDPAPDARFAEALIVGLGWFVVLRILIAVWKRR
jgi:hypothetical protein